MEVLIVPDDGLVRAGGRLAAALGRAHHAVLLSMADYTSSAAPGPNVGVILLADAPPAELEGTAAHESHGVAWGTRGNIAWVSASGVDDPSGTLDAMGAVISELQAEADAARAPFDADPSGITGLPLASLYLDPQLPVPAQTMAGGQFSFTPERMCWERQYTLGIVTFLARGFDEWASQISG